MSEEAPGPKPSRWWLNTALARLAFGASTQGAGRRASQGPQTPSMALLQALQQAEVAFDLDDAAQREFGDYELLELIGQGGMGLVYRARQRDLDREVAIKLLSAGTHAPEILVEMLRREAHHAAVLQHPNIVTVHELGEHAGLLFYAMQLVRGRSLSQRLEEDGPLPPREAAELLRTVAEAVHYAHQLGVLHLDLKPGNLLLDERGAPLVADFGLARRLEQALEPAHVAGTPAYMAPEQARTDGPPLSPATDVWALGAVLYETLTGHAPFEGGDPATTLRLLREAEVRRPSRYASVPADLEAICLKCLRKDPAQRYPDARALADDLGHFLAGHAVSVRPLNGVQHLARWARREPRLAVAVLVALLALLGGVVAASLQSRRAEANAATASARLWESRREAALGLEQDGKGFGALSQLLQNIEEEEGAGRLDLATVERRRIGMLLGQGAVLIDRTAVADANPLAVAVSPDGRLLAIGFNDQTVRWYDTTTLHERGRTSLQDRISSDGQRRAPALLRFVDNHLLRATLEWYSNLASPDNGDSWLIDLDRQAVVDPPAAFPDFADASYGADGQHVLLRNHRFQSQLWALAPWRPTSALLRPPPQAYLPWLLAPDGSYAAMLTVNMRHLLAYSLPEGEAHSLSFPGDAGIAAWNTSHDGRWIALGDFEGRVFLVDTRAWTLRKLPTGRGREITWVEFSEDDAWLAAGSWDGIAYAFDVASGDTVVSMPMRQDFVLRRVGLSHARRLLVAAGEGQVALWRLPVAGPRGLPAQRIGLGPAEHGLAGAYAIGWSLDTGLLATAGLDGQVRLWRLPLSSMATARSAHQIPGKTWFDGHHLVDVDGNLVRVVAIRGAPGPWLPLPQPPGFAELVDDGHTLLVTVGPQLRIYDAASLRLRMPPIALPSTPQRLLASDDGTRLLLDFAAPGPRGFEDHLRMWDLRDGRALPGEAVVTGPLRHVGFSADGTRLLAVGPADGATTVLRSAGLRPLGELPQDPFQPVLWADFAADGQRLALVARAPDPRLGTDSLLWWDYARDTTTVFSTGQARPLGVISTPHGAFVAGARDDLREDGGGKLTGVPRLAASEPTAVLALSRDGRFIARGFRREVQIHDLASGATVGRPLQLDSDAIDVITQLAFAPDGRRLLARTVAGRWQVWPIASADRSVADLSAGLLRLSATSESQRRVHIPAASERAALRAADPGPWPALEARPTPPGTTWTTNEHEPIPPRAPDLSPLMLDLGAIYDFGPEEVRNTYYNIEPMIRPMPFGVQRFDGVDYDLRGAISVGSDSTPLNPGAAHALRCVPLPSAPIAALRLLLDLSLHSASPDVRTIAVLRLRYRDGGSATVPLRTGRELPGFAGGDQNVKRVFSPHSALAAFGYAEAEAAAPRLPNPHPQRPLRCFDLQTLDETTPFLLFAVTADPVIAAVESRTNGMNPHDRLTAGRRADR